MMLSMVRKSYHSVELNDPLNKAFSIGMAHSISQATYALLGGKLSALKLSQSALCSIGNDEDILHRHHRSDSQDLLSTLILRRAEKLKRR